MVRKRLSHKQVFAQNALDYRLEPRNTYHSMVHEP